MPRAPALAHPAAPCDRAVQQLPPRAAAAPTGREFAQQVAALSGVRRDAAVIEQLRAGNVPGFLRDAVPVRLAGASLGRMVHMTLCVLPDYLSVGSDADFLLVPLGLDAARAVAQAWGFTLPTRKIVDAIYAQARVHLRPEPLPASDDMRSTAYVVHHNELVREQREAAHAPLSALTAGHKKDLVLTNRLWAIPGRVAIYGWHRAIDAPIQPLSLVHGARYADYSHGVRLVAETVWVDGQPRSITELLADERLAPLLSDEGPLRPLEALQTAALDH